MIVNNFISNTSLAGLKLGYQREFKPNMTLGITGTWNSFDEYVSKTTYQKPDGTGAITTDIVKQVYSVPLALTFNYYMNKGKSFVPYAGLGIGTQYSEQTLYFNIYSIEDDTWGFLLRPEIGAVYALKGATSLYFSATYNYATNNSDFFDNNSLSHFALSIGCIFGSNL